MPQTRLSRRGVLASLGATPVASVIAGPDPRGDITPSAAHTPDVSPQTRAVLVATLRLDLATPVDATVGSATIVGGEARGELAGAVQPGSLEWTRDPVRGVLQLAARFEVQARAGLRIHVADRATVVTPTTGCWAAPFPTTPELTVVDGSPAACPDAVYLGRMDASQLHAGELRLTVHRVL
jgi:hypothetical protein